MLIDSSNAANKYLLELISKLYHEKDLSDTEFTDLISAPDNPLLAEKLAAVADKVRRQHYGDQVYVRGLIEFTNYCKNNCFYCGIRASNPRAERYRLSREEILGCCQQGYQLGFRTFVLQGGEDSYYTDDRICNLVSSIHRSYPDCAITLSIGEKERASYEAYYAAGANRYLLRHEAAGHELYRQLHPENMSLDNRKRCLWDLKDIGYQVGAGFMVGAPFQKPYHLLEDLRFLQELQPDMIGIGPYIHHADTPFRDKADGTLYLSLRMLSILRLCFPYALLPSTTALGTIAPNGRELGLKAGGNVVMPNLSPVGVRKKYSLYNNKICTGEEAAECRSCLETRVHLAGYKIVTDRGDVKR